MRIRNIIFPVHCSVAFFLALQVWVWLRYGGALWLSDSLDMMEALFKSISPLRTSLEGFLYFIVPVLAISFIARNRLVPKQFLAISILIGVLSSFLYLVNMAFFNFVFIKQQIWVYVLAGSISGLVFGTISILPWDRILVPPNPTAESITRRRLLGSAGLLVGTAGLFGSLLGPFYFWRNQDKFIDVELEFLEEGQMMVVKVANRPVWIIKRSPDVIQLLSQENPELRDPRSKHSRQPESAENSLRSIRPEYLVVVGICTHLGCAPTYEPDGGSYVSPDPQFFCPCHGGVFDLAGRVFNGTPPPENMIIPDHEYLSRNVVRLYFPTLGEEWNA